MTRVTARQIAVQMLFSMEANSASAEDTLALFFSDDHYDSLRDEDKLFQEAPDQEQTADIHRVLQTARSTLAILRCALCEILFMNDIPDSAAVNEAVELGKSYDSPQAAAFINGVLGSFLRERKQSEQLEVQTEAMYIGILIQLVIIKSGNNITMPTKYIREEIKQMRKRITVSMLAALLMLLASCGTGAEWLP